MTAYDTPFTSSIDDVQYVETADARYAYRRLGPPSDVPLVMAMRFRGTLDHWDPALLDVLTAQREIIVFDNRGTGRSSGQPPASVDGLAAGLLDFVDALGLTQIDLLGWSMGGFVVQAAALQRPTIVRRLIVAGSGPGRMPGLPAMPDKVLQVMTKPENDDEDLLYLFFPETQSARDAGSASLRRIDTRLGADPSYVSPNTVKAQLAAITSFGTGVWDRLPELGMPVLVANGAQDVMISAFASYSMSQRLPDAKVILYSDAGHGFLFQYAGDFGREILTFLA
jgi:pimeloyl-ACP methyl ester carboxylesterase